MSYVYETMLILKELLELALSQNDKRLREIINGLYVEISKPILQY